MIMRATPDLASPSKPTLTLFDNRVSGRAVHESQLRQSGFVVEEAAASAGAIARAACFSTSRHRALAWAPH